MRVRTHPTRRASSLIGLLGAVALMAGLLTMSPMATSPAAADHCDGTGGIDGDGIEVDGFCFGHSPGRQPATAGYTPAQLWNIYCESRSFPGYEDGFTVDISFLGELDAQRIIDQGLDPTGTYGSYLVNCLTGDDANEGNFGYFIVWELTAPVPLEVLRDRARERINPPDPEVAANPPLNHADRFGVVGIPTWFWVENWASIGPEAETSGLITVEVMAIPTATRWDLGDGETIECRLDPPVPWSPGMPDSATDCLYKYTSSSADLPGETYEVTGTILWSFDWWINGAPQGSFEDFETDTVFTYPVGEIQAVESS